MKNNSSSLIKIFYVLVIFMWLISCQNKLETTKETAIEYHNLDLNEEFKNHWFDGKAEVSSFRLDQMRYGESREGSAVLIFVKEPFLTDVQVKANTASGRTVDVMKLNYTKHFNTGIYPYNIMQSVFMPLSTQPHALKVTASTQEWCGQTYMQLNNKEEYHVQLNSYFEGEADQNLKLDKHLLENELWVKLRINPTEIPQGELKVIPDFSYFRLKHIPVKPYQATIDQKSFGDTLVTSLKYDNIDRILKIYQYKAFPYQIFKWQEMANEDSENFTQATLQRSMRIDYWNKNANVYLKLRDSLMLK